MSKLEGNCECRKVAFEIDQKITELSHCHCTQCRRLHGAAYASFIEVYRSSFQYISGEDCAKSYAPSEDHERIFCSNCGSNILVSLEPYPDKYYVALGLINGNPELPEAYHIFVGSKAPWHQINDDLVKYDEDSPS
ncbi:MAG TPA: GFA family protein [Gammaproteobacteria bacterium]|jgi:hypothetical protein|nr:GFA family protein [Gammaproteobacteria bacterium]